MTKRGTAEVSRALWELEREGYFKDIARILQQNSAEPRPQSAVVVRTAARKNAEKRGTAAKTSGKKTARKRTAAKTLRARV